MELANETTNEGFIHLLKKVGSNFFIKDRTLLFEPRSAWRILAESGFGGGTSKQPAPCADHIFDGNLNSDFLRCLLDKVRNYFEQNPND